MKPDPNAGGYAFNFHAIPLWIKPELWNETKKVRFRGLLFMALYSLSMAVFGAIFYIPIGIYKGKDAIGTTTVIWLVLSLFGGVVSGLGGWWDVIRASSKIAADATSSQENKSSTNIAADG